MFHTISSHLGEFKKYALLSPLCVIIEVSMDIAIPYLMSLIIDNGIVGESREDLIKIGAILVAAVLISFISGMSSGYFATKASAGLAKNLRYSMFKNIQAFSFRNIDSFSTGSLVTRMTTDVQNLQTAFQMSIRIAIRSPLMLIFAFVMSFKINQQLALNFLMIIPVLVVGMGIIIKMAYPIFRKVFRMTDRLNTTVSENLMGIRVVKSFVREEDEVNKFSSISDTLFQLYTKASKLLALSNPLMQLSIYTIALLISWFGAKFIVDGSLTTGALMSLITYAFQIQISLMLLSMILVQLTIARNARERVAEVLNTTPGIQNPKTPVREIKDGSVTFDHVYFSYNEPPEKYVLEDIDFTVKSGDYVGIIGPTGSSKSTLIHLIPRLYDATKGEVRVGGVDVRQYDLDFLRDNVSVVLQKNQLFTGTVMENLRWGNQTASTEEVIQAGKMAQAHDFIMEAGGYDTTVERGGTNFSGGQRQRLCIARALLKNPRILIMDDSTSALDNTTEQNIVQSLQQLMPSMTKILISQRISSLKNCDYIIVLDRGHVESIGTHEELLNHSKIYSEIALSQEKGGVHIE
ncbi:MAG: ABC transporter ATP-binding protein [Tissierellia bacterium]|nr:ABC transporter ATP-binding protein [Tissierellia bacterium]